MLSWAHRDRTCSAQPLRLRNGHTRSRTCRIFTFSSLSCSLFAWIHHRSAISDALLRYAPRSLAYPCHGEQEKTSSATGKLGLFRSGAVFRDDMRLTPIGLICREVLTGPLEAFSAYSVAERAIMPNHIHLIVVNEGEHKRKSLSHLIARMKGKMTRECRREGLLAQGEPLWQRGFYDHIIRDEEDRRRIVEYIANNPLKWCLDRFYTGL